MKPTSKHFDSIRNIKSSKKKAPPPEEMCQWKGCDQPGAHKAPMGRDYEGHYFKFCITHVRQYNKDYNYFSGLDDEAIHKYQKENITGQRPTWKVGSNAAASGVTREPLDPRTAGANRLYNRGNYAAEARSGRLSTDRGRKIKVLEKKAFDELNLKYTATTEDIKRRYKDLVKQNHPDANGGDRSSEARLGAIIKAYKHLQKAGYC